MSARIGSTGLVFGLAIAAAIGAGYFWGARSTSRDDRLRAAVSPSQDVQGPTTRRVPPTSSVREPVRFQMPVTAEMSSTAAVSPEPPPSPEQTRADHVNRIVSSGPDTRGLVSDARRVGDNWSKVLGADGFTVSFDEWQCFRAGCFVSARHASAGAVDGATDAITRSRGFMQWNGEKIRTGPVSTPDGETEVAWILLAPAEGESALARDFTSDDDGPTAAAPLTGR